MPKNYMAGRKGREGGCGQGVGHFSEWSWKRGESLGWLGWVGEKAMRKSKI